MLMNIEAHQESQSLCWVEMSFQCCSLATPTAVSPSASLPGNFI
uniref:Uncharacterized protein n=1 Tax=Anguilla anguilla TaxID=7936 RepID=A0A0E9QZU7_ANGAN